MKLPEFPKEIKKGSVSVVIYKTPSKGYTHYTLAYYQDGQRKREYSNDYSALLNRAVEVLDDLNQGRPTVEGALKTADRSEFVRAKDALRSKNINLPLDVVARHFAEAVKLLDGDLVIQAAREYVQRHPRKLPQKTVTEVVAEFIEAKRAKGVSHCYIEDLSHRLGKFKASGHRATAGFNGWRGGSFPKKPGTRFWHCEARRSGG